MHGSGEGGAPVPPPQLTALLDRPLRGARVAVLDLETTGFEAEARVVEVAVVLLRELGTSQPEVVFRSFVNPDPVPVGWRAREQHQIGDIVLRRAPPWEVVWHQVAPHLEGAVWAAHNSVFDHRILQGEAATLDLAQPPPRLEWLDTMPLLKLVDAAQVDRTLEGACRRRGIQAGKHRAAADALATALLLSQLLLELPEHRHLRAPTEGTVREFLAWQWMRKADREREARKLERSLPTTPAAPVSRGPLLSRAEADELVRRRQLTLTSNEWSESYRCRRVGLLPVTPVLPRSAELCLWEIEDGKLALPKVVPDVERPFWRASGVVLGRLRLTIRLFEEALWKALVFRVALHLEEGRRLAELWLPGWSHDEVREAARAARGST